MKLKRKNFEALIIINKTDSKTLCEVLTEYHALSDGIVPPYTIESWQLAPDKHILSFPKGITFEEFDNLLTWLDNEIKTTKDIYGYNSTKKLKGIRTLEKAMFWIDPIYKISASKTEKHTRKATRNLTNLKEPLATRNTSLPQSKDGKTEPDSLHPIPSNQPRLQSIRGYRKCPFGAL